MQAEVRSHFSGPPQRQQRMSHESMQTLADPLLQSKMPLFDGTVASVELSKPQTMPGFLGKQKLQYNGAYFTYDPRMKDGAGFTPPWSSSQTSPLDDRSPVSHLSGMVVQNHMIYRKDGISAEESLSHSSPKCHSPVKKGFMPYTKSPEISSPSVASPVIIRKPLAGGESSSSPSQTPVYIAIPKPVYGLNPCCNELGCVMGQRYDMEHVSPRIPNAVYEHDWVQSNRHYAEKPPSQRKEALLQQKDLQFECSAEQLKRMTVEGYSPNRARTLPSVIEPTYSSYPCAQTHTLFGSLREHGSQSLQTPPGGYPGLYASRPTYEHMTSEVYQECSPMSKYGQLAQHPVFYYSQANGEVESRTQRKDGGGKQGEGAPLFHKHTLSNPREHYVVPQIHRAEIPLSCTEMLPSHSLIRGFDYPCYALPGFHSQIRAPLKRQHSLSAFHPSHITVSPTRQHIEHPVANEKACPGLHVNQLHRSSSFLRVEQSSPTRRVNPADVSPPSVQAGKFFQPYTSLHIDAPVIPPAGVIPERVLDHSSCEAQVKQPKSLPVSPAAWLHPPPGHSSDPRIHRIHAAVHHNPNIRNIIYSPAATTGSKHNGLVSAAGTTDYKKCLKRSTSRSSPPIKIKKEDRDLYEVECTNKRQKVEKENVKTGNKTDSPPMPVINNVFSLAPYQSQLQKSKVLSAVRVPQKSTQMSEQQEDKLEQKVKEKRPDQNDRQPVVCLVSKEISSHSPALKSDAEVFDPIRVKVETVDSSNLERESQNRHSKVTIKTEPKDTGSADSGPTLLKEKRQSDESESKLLHAGETPIPEELKPAEFTTQITPSSQEDMLHKQMVTLQPQSVPPLHPPGSKVSFKSIPPHCLKLSTYNIILPGGTHCRTLPHAQEKPSSQPVTVLAARPELPTPVRKHFLELHQALCNLISKTVSASPEQDLKNWLSRLEITEPAHVPCLLGARAREPWINEDIKSALRDVLERLREYTAQRRCPFPHVMRTGAVFLPMLVVKELLFPTVQGSFIDKVLQEHKVELRPTTLSEEKILIQLHKRACSSRLRRLMSLKHLPDIYTETLNLLYYTCVCKHLGLDVDPVYKDHDGSSEVSNGGAPAFSDATASPASPSEPQHHQGCTEETPKNESETKGRAFLGKMADEERAGDAMETAAESETKECDHVAAEQDCAVAPQGADLSDSWTCPLSPSDTETEESSGALPEHQTAEPQVQSKHCSGMILKLRKMLGGGLHRKKARYEAVSESGTLGESSLPQSDAAGGKKSLQKKPKVTHKWQAKRGFSRAFRPLGSPSKPKRRSLLKIKYCPYLSACHSGEHRRRWVLRSAVQRARGAMRFYYPDLVGKRIRHLYEEDDKSEVWYRGEVLRIHEAHTNPLKTIFEVRYDSEPEWKYYLELLIDYKKGWLKIED
ncbi:uncharacterized protein C15orf39 homolog isoform X2 [Kryptolebias marmoratus]|uniref:uncharacterized protein C15orf39 homolog isoform X2 n=1 Tax=Kryptolebias marmoratus TaxID=37003 RepID=UPI0007F88859|nr:uncharacterized protein C15orf39 homolog isoform X2 [Kryptolebias marmoratus]